jgi:hypothetical protein
MKPHRDIICGQWISFTVTRHVTRSEVKGSSSEFGGAEFNRAREKQSDFEWRSISWQENQSLIDFLKTALDLNMSSDPKENTKNIELQ